MPNSDKTITNKKKLRKVVGAALAAPVVVPLVSLSGFVPAPVMVQSARAGSTTLSVTGQFITGISLVKKADMKWGKMVATDTGGKISLTTAGAHANSAKAVGLSGEGAGQYTYKAATTTAGFDITVKGMGALALGATTGGAAAAGTAKLTKVLFGKVFDTGKGDVTCTVGPGTSCKSAVAAADFDVKSGTAKLGGVISWTAPQPIGQFGQALTIIMSY